MRPFKPRISAFLCLLLVACAAPQTAEIGAWGAPLLVAQAPQSAAPAAIISSGALVTAWVGADERGVHHDARRVGLDEALASVVTLPLPPRYPRLSQWVAGLGDRLHLLWLDADENGDTRLYSALLDGALTVMRGPTSVGDAGTFRYNAIADNAGGALAAWSHGLPAEPTVTIGQIDYEGRPIQTLATLPHADYPLLFRTVDGIQLLWRDVRGGVVCLSPFRSDAALTCQRRLPSVSIGRGDLLLNLRAGTDRTHVYLFWNIDRAEGGFETWVASAPLGGDSWSALQRLTFTTLPEATIQTGYNSGQVDAAQLGGEAALALAAPLASGGDTLPVGGQSGGVLGVLYLQAGQVVGYQSIATARLLAPPLLLSDRDRHLYLAWSDAVSSEDADLRLVSTR